jgi:hypothetical protein
VCQDWHIEAVADAHEILDIREEAERKAHAKANQKNW